MPHHSIRFIQAANVFLNHQLVGTGYLEESLQEQVQHATISSFRNLVDAACEQEVDFLLLVGNCFDVADSSLGAYVELIAGFSDLEAAGISVVVLPGPSDPLEAWQSIHNLPDHVHLIEDPSAAAATINRNGKPIAHVGSLYSSTFRKSEQPNSGDSSQEIFQIAMSTREDFPHNLKKNSKENGISARLNRVSLDYLALGGGKKETVKLEQCQLHDSGGTQGLKAEHVQEHGATLVEVDETGEISSSFIPTAVVRWECLHIGIGSHSTVDELTNLLKDALQDVHPQTHERLWLLQWTIDNSGPLFKLIQQDGFRKKLQQSLLRKLSLPEHIEIVSRYRLFPTTNTMQSLAEENRLASLYFDTVESEWNQLAKNTRKLLQSSNLRDEERTNRLRSLLPELDHQAVLGHAQQLGVSWFTNTD